MIPLGEGKEKAFAWEEDRRWWWGYDFDTGTHGPFPSFDAAVENWRKWHSKQRGKDALRP